MPGESRSILDGMVVDGSMLPGSSSHTSGHLRSSTDRTSAQPLVGGTHGLNRALRQPIS